MKQKSDVSAEPRLLPGSIISPTKEKVDSFFTFALLISVRRLTKFPKAHAAARNYVWTADEVQAPDLSLPLAKQH